MVVRLSEIQQSKIEVMEMKKNKFLAYEKDKLISQTPWVTISKFGLSSKQFIKQTDETVDLSIPIEEGSELYQFFEKIDNILMEKHVYNTEYNKIVRERDGTKYIRFKLNLDTKIYVEKELQEITDVYDFYDYIKYQCNVRVIFTFGRIYSVKTMHGITLRAMKIQVEKQEPKEPHEIEFED